MLTSKLPEFLDSNLDDMPLSDLFPYDIDVKMHSELSHGLKEYKFLLIAAKQALTLFLSGNLASFDALVGENSCQIRATILALVANKPQLQIKEHLNGIHFVLSKVSNFLRKFDHERIKTKVQLGEFLKKNQLEISLPFFEIFLIGSFILTKVRVLLPPNYSKRIVRNESTDTRKVKEIGPVGSTFSRDLVKKIRSIVSQASVSFVQDIANFLPVLNSVAYMVSDKYCLTHDKFGRLECLPSFWYTLICIEYSLAMELPLVFVVSQIASDKNDEVIHEELFHFIVVDVRYQFVTSDQISDDSAVLTVLGSCCRKSNEFPSNKVWKEEILSINPKELLLAYAAAHRQYPDEAKDKLVENSGCKLYSYYKDKAHSWGCSLDNPSLFFLVHAYCDRKKNVFRNIRKTA